VQLGRFPRVPAAYLPTPLEEMERLTKRLGGPKLYIKRDDNTGLALGGNKARKLAYLVGDALQRGCDALITVGGPQSNHCRMTAAMGAKYGLKVVLVLTGEEPPHYQANLLIDTLLGAELVFTSVEGKEETDAVLVAQAKRLEEEGRRPYIIPLGGSTAVGSLGYVEAMMELVQQANLGHISIDHLIVATGSGGTQGGLLLGSVLLNTSIDIHGIMVSPREPDYMKGLIEGVVAEGYQLLTGAEASDEQMRGVETAINLHPEYAGPGYGVATAAGIEAIELLARTEGILLDPVYTGKAMAGLIDLVRQGGFAGDETVVFLHTGGAPGLFAYSENFQRGMKKQ